MLSRWSLWSPWTSLTPWIPWTPWRPWTPWTPWIPWSFWQQRELAEHQKLDMAGRQPMRVRKDSWISPAEHFEKQIRRALKKNVRRRC
jgi:hypothetical protein